MLETSLCREIGRAFAEQRQRISVREESFSLDTGRRLTRLTAVSCFAYSTISNLKVRGSNPRLIVLLVLT